MYFTQPGIVSTIAGADAHYHGVGVSVISRERLVGCCILLDRNDTIALGTTADHFPALPGIWWHYIWTLIVQTSQRSACNSEHTLFDRCARGLLMVHDRIDGYELGITPEFLAVILGVRRSGVAEAALLPNAGAIRYRRGYITVLNRARLASPCKSYWVLGGADHGQFAADLLDAAKGGIVGSLWPV
jgi:hypothetical protein